MPKKKKQTESKEVIKVSVDKRRLISPFNRFKYGKRSRLIGLTCDNCVYGPNGLNKCPFAEPGKLCVINEQLRKFMEAMGITDVDRDPNALVNALIPIYVRKYEDLMRVMFFSDLEGGVPDRVVDRELNAFIKVHDMLLRTLAELGRLRKESVQTSAQDEIVKLFMAVWRKKSSKHPVLEAGASEQ